jgi:hypothetical protein
MDIKGIFLFLILVVAMITGGYHFAGRDRAPRQLVVIFDATEKALTYLEETVVTWVYDASDEIVRALLPKKDDEKAKQKLSEQGDSNS